MPGTLQSQRLVMLTLLMGAAFAALSLGFLGEDDPVAVYESGPWTRLTTKRGHVLVKRRAWTLAR